MRSPAESAFVRRIEISLTVYTALAALIGWRWHSARFAWGIAGGGAITYLNFLVVAGLVGKALRAQKKRYWVAYAAKSLLLFGLIVGLIYSRAVDALPLLVGLLSIFAAVLVVAGMAVVDYIRLRRNLSPGPQEK